MTTCLPVSPALSTLELLAGRVVPVPFDGCTVVEGTICLTTASSPDAEVRGILAARLEKAKGQIKTSKSKKKVLDCKSTGHLPVASSLRGAVALPHHRPCTLRMSGLGIYAWSGAVLPVTPHPSRFLFCTTKVRHQYCLYKI